VSAHLRERDLGALAAAAHLDGCLLLPALLPIELVRSAGARLAAACDFHGLALAAGPPTSWSDPRLIAVQAEVLASRELRAVADHDALGAILAAIFGGDTVPVRAGGDVCRIAFPASARPHQELATPPHQDAFYMKPDGPVWIAWIPLDDCPLERGPLAVIAGSHAAGLRPHTGDSLDTLRAHTTDEDRWTAGDLAAGDVLLLDALTVHRALDNRSDGLRLSADFRFRAAR